MNIVFLHGLSTSFVKIYCEFPLNSISCFQTAANFSSFGIDVTSLSLLPDPSCSADDLVEEVSHAIVKREEEEEVRPVEELVAVEEEVQFTETFKPDPEVIDEFESEFDGEETDGEETDDAFEDEDSRSGSSEAAPPPKKRVRNWKPKTYLPVSSSSVLERLRELKDKGITYNDKYPAGEAPWDEKPNRFTEKVRGTSYRYSLLEPGISFSCPS